MKNVIPTEGAGRIRRALALALALLLCLSVITAAMP